MTEVSKFCFKAIIVGAIPLFGGGVWGADGKTESPATQPAAQLATRSSTQSVALSNNDPLIIPDGTSGRVQQQPSFLSGVVNGIRD